MAQITVPEAPKEYATQYKDLLGVDFQTDQTSVNARRSPDMVNMISDYGGNPVKRDGYRRVGRRYEQIVMAGGLVYGIFQADDALKIAKIAIDGYDIAETDTATLSLDVGTVKAAFTYQQSIYIVATLCLVKFDTIDRVFSYSGIGSGMMSTGTVGESAPVNTGNIPTTVISLKPDGTGGVTLDDKNLLSIYQTVSYQGNGTATAYKIPNYSKIGTYIKAEVKDSSGEWQTATASVGASSAVTGRTLDGTGTMTNNVVSPTVTFATAPSAPLVTGEDNVRITFCPYSTEQTDSVNRGYYNETIKKLLSSKAVTLHNGRMFIATDYKVYYSDVSDMFSLSDLAWFEVDNEIMCFTRSSSYLAVITKDVGRNTIYLASEASRTVDSSTGETETYFSVKPSNAGVGAVSPKCVATLSDEPLFLSGTGIFGIQTNWQSEKYAINRSTRINRKLCREPNLETAVGISFNDYFWLAVNGRMYILDGRRRESDKAGNTPFEAYYFEGLPGITDMFVANGRMYFIDNDYTYTWNDDLAANERYYDNARLKYVSSVAYQLGDTSYEVPTGEWLDEEPEPVEGKIMWYRATYNDGTVEDGVKEVEAGDSKLTGTATCAKWCSLFDDDGAPQKLKTLMKKGSMVTVVPHYQTGCEITLVKDGDKSVYIGRFDADMQTFENINFDRFTFKSNGVAVDAFTRKKLKKYKRLQIQITNNEPEPFGLIQITKTFTVGNYAKR